MNGPMTNHELGKALHREYEANASRTWGQETTDRDQQSRAGIHKLALAVSGAIMTIFLTVQLF